MLCSIFFFVQQVSRVLKALQAGSRGTQACLDAIEELKGIVGDIETTTMFASAGTLSPDGPEDTFANHR